MNPFSQLQASVLFQVGGDQQIVKELSQTARNFIAATAMVVVASFAAPGSANAQNGESPITPSRCAMVGGGVGGIAGGMLGKTSWEMRALGAAIGAFGGAVAGHYVCSSKDEPAQQPQQRQPTRQSQPLQQSQYVPIAQVGSVYPARASVHVQAQPQVRMIPLSNSEYESRVHPETRGVKQGPSAVAVSTAGGFAAVPLSISEAANLDSMLSGVDSAKAEWKKNLELKDRGIPVSDDAQLRDFENQRVRFATVVSRLAQGGQSAAPRQASKYLEAACANMEIPTHRGVTYQQVIAADPSSKSNGIGRVLNANTSSCAPRAS